MDSCKVLLAAPKAVHCFIAVSLLATASIMNHIEVQFELGPSRRLVFCREKWTLQDSSHWIVYDDDEYDNFEILSQEWFSKKCSLAGQLALEEEE